MPGLLVAPTENVRAQAAGWALSERVLLLFAVGVWYLAAPWQKAGPSRPAEKLAENVSREKSAIFGNKKIGVGLAEGEEMRKRPTPIICNSVNYRPKKLPPKADITYTAA